MKVFITGGCASRAYVEYFQTCFPDWEVRASVLVQATDWIENGNEKFLEYISSADVFVGLTDRAPVKDHVNPDAKKIFLPSFDFFGYHPDSVFLLGVTSPLEIGVIHSRIVSSCFALGKSESYALSRFNEKTFENLGYFTMFESEKQRVLKKFNDWNLNISDHLENWLTLENFLYTVNHPDTRVFFDIASAAVEQHFDIQVSESQRQQARANLNNYMADGLIWPVYPEIASRLGMPATEYQWRTTQIRKEPTYLNLEEFVARSYKQLELVGGIPESGVAKIGGIEAIERVAA